MSKRVISFSVIGNDDSEIPMMTPKVCKAFERHIQQIKNGELLNTSGVIAIDSNTVFSWNEPFMTVKDEQLFEEAQDGTNRIGGKHDNRTNCNYRP